MILYNRLIFKDLWLKYNFKLLITIMLTITTGFAEGVSILFLMPFLVELGLIESVNHNILNNFYSFFENFIIMDWMGILLIIIFLCFFQLILIISNGWMLSKISQNYLAFWKEKLFISLLKTDLSFINNQRTGDLSSVIVNETNRLHSATMSLLSLMAILITTFIYLIYSFIISIPLTLLIISSGIILAFSLSFLYNYTKEIGYKIGPAMSEQQVIINESFMGIKDVKANVIESLIFSKFSEIVRKIEKYNRYSAFIPYLVRGFFENFGLISLLVILVISVNFFKIDFANIIVLFTLFIRIFPRLSSIQQYMHTLNANAPSILRIKELLNNSEINKEIERLEHNDLKLNKGNVKLVIKKLNVTLNKNKIITDLNLQLNFPGMICIIGKTGSGKSTLMTCLLNLIKYDGNIIVNGENINFFDLKYWRKKIGYLPQDSFLFHSSIKKNILLDKENSSDKLVVDACKKAEIHNFIEGLPNKYNTIIGDQGVLLSGGQRQRIGLARALALNPEILLLDEATSSLDTKTERKIFNSLLEISKDKGVIFITHKIDLIEKADYILVMDEGKLVDEGDWYYLKQNSKPFNKIIEKLN